MGRIFVEEIRHEYPQPKRCTERSDVESQYCVGGAFIMKRLGGGKSGNYASEIRFPTAGTLASEMLEANPMLSEDTALQFAESIIAINDDKDFEAAWFVLAKALNYEGERQE